MYHHVLQEFAAFGWSGECKAGEILDSLEMGNDFERIALVYEEGLAFRGIEHLFCIFGNEGVEERIEAFVVSALCSEDSAEALCFLTSGSVMRGNLDETGSFREIEGSVTDFGEEEGVDIFIVLEIFQDAETFVLCGASEDKGLV